MSFLKIIQSWIRKSTDYDNAFGYQCVDWARQFAKDSGNPIGTFSGSAINGWRTGSPFVGTKWRKVINYPWTPAPKEGDIIFWNTGTYGHVAIADRGCTLTKLKIIEQNGVGTRKKTGEVFGDGKRGNAIRRRTTTYLNVVGWYTLQ